MKLSLVLQCLKRHDVQILDDRTDKSGIQTIVLGCLIPAFAANSGKYAYATISLDPGQDEVSMEERDSIRRRLCHLTTDIFGDDPDLADLKAVHASDDDDENGEAHFHTLVPKS